MAEPLAAWLLQDSKASDRVVGIALIVVFALLAVLLAVSLVPLLHVTFELLRAEHIEPEAWRRLFGTSFMSSLVGLLALGVLRRVGK